MQEIGSAVPVVRIGWPDQFIEHGKIDELRAKYGLTVEEAYAQISAAACDTGSDQRLWQASARAISIQFMNAVEPRVLLPFGAVDRLSLPDVRVRQSTYRNFRMRPLRFALACLSVTFAAGICCWPQTPPQVVPRPPSTPLVLEGGTVIDVTDWGRSASDLQDSIVIVRDGRITDVGSRATCPDPQGRASD